LKIIRNSLFQFDKFRFFYCGTLFVLIATFLYGWERPKPLTSIAGQARV